MWTKIGKNKERKKEVKKMNLSTKHQHIVLASSSITRQREIRKHFKNAIFFKHKINEAEEKKKRKQLNAKDLAYHLAKLKAMSASFKFKDKFIIGCDQTLECDYKILSKPKTLIKAKENLKKLSGKNHRLYTCIYVLRNLREYFVEETSAELSFKKTTNKEINDYIEKNVNTVLSCVGSYKIEENEKYKFIKIIKGDKESIIGFPLKKFLKKIREE